MPVSNFVKMDPIIRRACHVDLLGLRMMCKFANDVKNKSRTRSFKSDGGR
jgi:ppGpp synthetase/RelA/SpoT-type nucleotidyltranferase